MKTESPATAEGRVQIAKKIIAEAAKYGIEKKDIVIDALAMTDQFRTREEAK